MMRWQVALIVLVLLLLLPLPFLSATRIVAFSRLVGVAPPVLTLFTSSLAFTLMAGLGALANWWRPSRLT